MKRSLATFVAVCLFVVLHGAAWAKPTVALTPIDGDKKGEFGDAVAEALDGRELSVIGPDRVSRAVDKLGFDNDLSEKQAKQVAAELEADAVILATLDRKGSNKVLKFRLYIGGKRVRGFTVTFNNARNERFQRLLREKIVQKIEDSQGGDDMVKSKKKKKTKKKRKKRKNKGDDDDDEPRVKKKKALGDDEDDEDADDGDDEDDEDGDDEDDEVDDAVRRVSPHAANRVAVRLDVGVSVQNRRLTFTSRKLDFPQAPNTYKNAPVPGARFETELYPLAFSNPKSIAAGLGLAAEYDKTISLTLATDKEPNVPLKATQQHWSVGGRIRIPFGSKPTSPTVTLGVDYGNRSFKTDRGPLMDPNALDIPDTQYKAVLPGLAIRVPIASVLALTLAGKAMIVLDAGAIQLPSQYGQSKVFGASGQAGFDIVLGNRFAIRLVGEFVQVGFSFVGTGAMSNARDNDPTTKDVGGAADRSIGGAATLAVLY